jgi:hypothetical protein
MEKVAVADSDGQHLDDTPEILHQLDNGTKMGADGLEPVMSQLRTW